VSKERQLVGIKVPTDVAISCFHSCFVSYQRALARMSSDRRAKTIAKHWLDMMFMIKQYL